jgi:hypothetical protein
MKRVTSKRHREPRTPTEVPTEGPGKAKRSGMCGWEEAGYRHAMLWRAKHG